MRLHESIKAKRIALELTIAEVARRAGLDDAHLYRFERGERAMSSDKVDRLKEVLGLELVEKSDHENPPGTLGGTLAEEPSAA